MTGWPESLLYEELDIAQYLYNTQCVRGSGLYTSSKVSGVDIGFNTDAGSHLQCKLSNNQCNWDEVSLKFPSICVVLYQDIFSIVCQLSVDFSDHHMATTTADKATCYLPSLCTAVDCCVEITSLSRSFNFYINIDPCNYLLRVGIDNFYFNQSLDRYTFGML